MLSKAHKLTEEITAALGPIFQKHPDYSIIQQAMGLVLGRIAQATPDAGAETLSLEIIHEYAKKALEEFLKLEAAAIKREKAIERGIDGFAEILAGRPGLGLAAINGGMGAEAQAAAEEAQEIIAAQGQALVEPGSAADYPDNSDKPVAKTWSVEVQKAMVEEEEAYKELTKLPEGVVPPEGTFSNPQTFEDPYGVFVEPPKEDETKEG